MVTLFSLNSTVIQAITPDGESEAMLPTLAVGLFIAS
jgi:hypothetical protein